MEVYFYKGNENVIETEKKEGDSGPIEQITDSFNKVLDGKNLSFLLGCGCSSFLKDGKEIGIPTMVPLAKEFLTHTSFEEDKKWLSEKLNLNVTEDVFAKNLEKFLSALHSIYFFYETTGQANTDIAIRVNKIITDARNFLIKKCLNEENKIAGGDTELIKLYQTFYRKLLFRNSNLRKLNVFTTNYDLYSEIAMDNLGIHYVNGFSGGIQKYFNPTIFNYALAEEMDLSQSKWSVIENFFYLYKIHGSLNWIMDDSDFKLFRVREIQETSYERLEKQEVVMIHPTPLKYNASLGSPYSDLFREFQKKLMQKNNVLVTLGYSFCDEHINNLIYQAFTIPSFRLIVLGDPSSSKEIEKLKSLNDPRIWIVGGKVDDHMNLHFFNGFVEKVLPDLSNDALDKKLETTFMELLRKRNEQGG